MTSSVPHAGSQPAVIPTGKLLHLRPEQLRPNPNNPRVLFDKGPLQDLKENIRTHGVLVPLTVYPLRGQERYAILDGERRYTCCRELSEEGHGEITLPANVVEPPDKIAGLLYMFSIHNYREAWELMPTALSLKVVMEELGSSDDRTLANLTGLREKQIQRCKILLDFPVRFQELSLDPNPATRIPSNFWIEAHPVIGLCEAELPELTAELGRDGVVDKLVEKYRGNGVRSVIHFRRILEAYQVAEDQRQEVLARLREYVLNPAVETRWAFDAFLIENRRVQTALRACEDFVSQIRRSQLDFAMDDRETLMDALIQVRNVVDELLAKLEGSDEPLELFGDESN